MTPSRFDLKALEYRGLADRASAAAEASQLDQTRQLHEAAAARWTELAVAEERRAATNRPAEPQPAS